jgi:hypothetical protein
MPEGNKGLLSKSDLDQIRKSCRRIHNGGFRFPWAVGGGTELLALMKPGEDDVEGKLFNFFSALSIYAGLLVSGLIGYVLAPAGKIEGTNELTGGPNQDIVHWQTLFAHANLILSMVMFAFTTYMSLFAILETPHTIQRTVSKAKGLWLYMFISFLQMLLIALQACLSAILNLEPRWAKITISVDVVIVLVMTIVSEDMMFGPNGMFPLSSYSWVWCAPVPFLKWLIWDTDVYKRIGQALVAEAGGHLGFEDFNEEESPDTPAEKIDEQMVQQEAELRTFLGGAVESLSGDRLNNIAYALMMEGLTLDLLVRTASKPQGFQTLFTALDISMVEIRRGERLGIVNAAAERAPVKTLPETTMHGI